MGWLTIPDHIWKQHSVSIGGSSSFSSDGVPSGTTVFTVFTSSSHADTYTLLIVASQEDRICKGRSGAVK